MLMVQIASLVLIFSDISSDIASMYLGSIYFSFLHTGIFGTGSKAPVWVSTFFYVIFTSLLAIFLTSYFLFFAEADLYLHFIFSCSFFLHVFCFSCSIIGRTVFKFILHTFSVSRVFLCLLYFLFCFMLLFFHKFLCHFSPHDYLLTVFYLIFIECFIKTKTTIDFL